MGINSQFLNTEFCQFYLFILSFQKEMRDSRLSLIQLNEIKFKRPESQFVERN